MNELATQTHDTPETAARSYLVTGSSVEETLSELSRAFPGCNGLAAITAAVDKIRASADCETATVVGWALEAYRTVYQRSLVACEFAAALRAVKELVALARDIPEKPGGNVPDDDNQEDADD